MKLNPNHDQEKLNYRSSQKVVKQEHSKNKLTRLHEQKVVAVVFLEIIFELRHGTTQWISNIEVFKKLQQREETNPYKLSSKLKKNAFKYLQDKGFVKSRKAKEPGVMLWCLTEEGILYVTKIVENGYNAAKIQKMLEELDKNVDISEFAS